MRQRSRWCKGHMQVHTSGCYQLPTGTKLQDHMLQPACMTRLAACTGLLQPQVPAAAKPAQLVAQGPLHERYVLAQVKEVLVP